LKNIDKLKESVEGHMNLLAQNHERVKKYFKHESINYAA